MRLHIGCGTIYLTDYWTNIDLPSANVFLAKERPDLVERWGVEEAHYYDKQGKDNIDKFSAGPKTIESVCDAYGSFQFIPARTGSVDEILARQVFEHNDLMHAAEALKECNRAMKKGGLLRIDVPDVDESVRLYGETKNDFYIRHIVGPRQKGAWGYHATGWTQTELITFANHHGFYLRRVEENIHCYPAFCLQFYKYE